METFYAFHLVTNNRMTVGQIIDFTEGQHNTLYRFFLEKEIRNEQQQDVFDVIAGKSTLNEEETAMVKRYLGSSIRAIREQITEFVRIQHFPHYPSRLSCLYATKTMEQAMEWKSLFESYNRQVLQLVKLKVEGRYFEGNAELLPKEDGSSFALKMEQAQSYWTNKSSGPLTELLIDGKIEVYEIIEEF
jgi:hypothetical protein